MENESVTTPKKSRISCWIPFSGIIVFVIVVLIAIPVSKNTRISAALNSYVKKDVIPLSTHIIDYSLLGHYGNILSLKVTDGFDALSLNERYYELKKIMKPFDRGHNMEVFQSLSKK